MTETWKEYQRRRQDLATYRELGDSITIIGGKEKNDDKKEWKKTWEPGCPGKGLPGGSW